MALTANACVGAPQGAYWRGAQPFAGPSGFGRSSQPGGGDRPAACGLGCCEQSMQSRQRLGERERRVDERDRLADEREELADEREGAADQRDRRADERERRADDRQRLADDASAPRTSASSGSTISGLRTPCYGTATRRSSECGKHSVAPGHRSTASKPSWIAKRLIRTESKPRSIERSPAAIAKAMRHQRSCSPETHAAIRSGWLHEQRSLGASVGAGLLDRSGRGGAGLLLGPQFHVGPREGPSQGRAFRVSVRLS